MATTSTNKQPLLVDRVMHVAVDMNDHKVAENTTTPGRVSGSNTAVKLVDSIAADGCVIETLYTISRSTSAYKINLYLSTSGDYLRPEQSIFIGQVQSATTAYVKSDVDDLPKVLAPVARVSEAQLRALYIPKGAALWAAVERPDGTSINETLSDAPVLGAQGGWY